MRSQIAKTPELLHWYESSESQEPGMHIRYSLYERMQDGYQWTWRAGDLKDILLDDFKYRIQMPNNANNIQSEDLIGGILKFAHFDGSSVDEHVVLFRFFNGGSDEGRSRVTMLAGWTTKDQFPKSQAANGILAIFRNQTFEDVSLKAQSIGIDQPYSLNSNEPVPANIGATTVALADFFSGLTDGDHDYLLTIHNSNHSLKKMPSAALKYRETEVARKTMKAEQIKAETEKKQDDVGKLRIAELGQKVREEAETLGQEHDRIKNEKRVQARKNKMSKILKVFMTIGCCAVLAYIAFALITKYGYWEPPEFENPSVVQEIQDRFKKLSPDDQNRLLKKLQPTIGPKQTVSPTPRESSPLKKFTPSFQPSPTEVNPVIPGKPQ